MLEVNAFILPEIFLCKIYFILHYKNITLHRVLVAQPVILAALEAEMEKIAV
jgi:hypothetical protein